MREQRAAEFRRPAGRGPRPAPAPGGHEAGNPAGPIAAVRTPEFAARWLAGDGPPGRGAGPALAAQVRHLQRTYGNRAVQRYLQREGGAAPSPAAPDLDERIRAASDGGRALDTAMRRRLEGGLGADLSGVRLHTDAEADRLARAVDAVAFTSGPDIFWRAGTYRPETQEGLHLLAHEAAHTLQQAAGPVTGTPAPGGVAISDPSDLFERAAEAAAARVAAGPGPDAATLVGPRPARGAGSALLARPTAAPRQGATTPVQRARHGLATEAKTTTYVGAAYGFWQAAENAGKPLADLGSFLVHMVNQQLPYPCAHESRPELGALGQFDHVTWSIWLNPGAFSKRRNVSSVGQLSRDEVANVVNTIYHEARHAEQHFLVARRRAGQQLAKQQSADQVADQIAKDMTIPPGVAAAAVAAEQGAPLPTATADDQAVLADAEAWDRSLHGRYLGYEGAIQALERNAEAIKALELERRPVGSQLSHLASEAAHVAYKAYKAFLHEKDAFAVGDAAGAAFRAYQPTGAPAEAAFRAHRPIAGVPAPAATAAAAPAPAPANSLAALVVGIKECLGELPSEWKDLKTARQEVAAHVPQDHLDTTVLADIDAVTEAFLDLLDVCEGRQPRSQPAPAEEDTDTDEETSVDQMMVAMVPVRGLKGQAVAGRDLLSTLAEPIDVCDGYLDMFQTKSAFLATQKDAEAKAQLGHVKAITVALKGFLDQSGVVRKKAEADQDAGITLDEAHPLLKAADKLHSACFRAQGVVS